jgi:hypothetical protein
MLFNNLGLHEDTNLNLKNCRDEKNYIISFLKYFLNYNFFLLILNKFKF